MIHVKQIENATLIASPFRYAIMPNFLTLVDADMLVTNLPTHSNYRSIREAGSDKTYNVVNNLLLKLGETTPSLENQLSPLWLNLVTELQSDIYISSLSRVLQENLTGCYQEITLKRYGLNDYISPHTDRADVAATHMIFLNNVWSNEWGGSLCLMKNPNKTFKRITPVSTCSVAFVRSDVSWHSVEKIVCPDVERIAIQVAFWNTKERNVLDGRIERTISL